MKLLKFVRKPFFVDAVQVTKENMQEVAKWCGGDVLSDFISEKDSVDYIKVRVQKPLNVRQTMAYVGDWVLLSGENSYKVYTTKAFFNTFDVADPDVKENFNYGSELPLFTSPS